MALIDTRKQLVSVCAVLTLFLVAPVCADEGQDTSVSVITAEEISRERPSDIMTLLRSRVGLDNSSGALTMRGVQGVAVYVDGFVSSTVELSTLKPQQVARIEILRGAASARFGAGAMGGAILVTTEKGFTTTDAELSQSLDSRGSSTSRFSGSHREGALNFGALGEYTDKHGHRAVPDAPFPGQITVEDEHSRSYSADAKLGYDGERTDTDLNIKHTQTNDSFGRPNWWWHSSATTARLTTAISEVRNWDYKIALGYEEVTDKALRDRGTGTDTAGLAADRYIFNDQAHWEVEISAARKFKESTLNIAFSENLIDMASRITDFVTAQPEFTLNYKTLNTAAQFLYQGKLSTAFDMEIGGRYDRFHYYDTIINDAALSAPILGAPITKDAFNPRLGLRWRPSTATSWSTNIGTGFVPPDPEQLYYEDLGVGSQFLANPDLEPQRSWTWDLGMQRKLDGERWGVNLFYTHWENKLGVLIVDYNLPEKRQWRNIGTAEARGVELDWERPLFEKWRLTSNYTYNHTVITENQADPSLVGNELPYMPLHKANISLAYNTETLNGRVALRYVGDTFTNERNTVVDSNGYLWRQDAYTVVDLTLAKKMSIARLAFSVDNLFDKHYVSGFFRQNIGRIFRGEFSWHF